VVVGMGQALYEDVVVENGQVMNPSFLDYGFPTFLEMPEIDAIEVETDDPIGPFGAKEAGEGTVGGYNSSFSCRASFNFLYTVFLEMPSSRAIAEILPLFLS
jgi:hypothetical protein